LAALHNPGFALSFDRQTPADSHAPRALGERLLIATLVLGAGDAAGKILALIITIIRTRSLSPAEYGGFGFIIQTIGMFAQAAGFSLGLAATRYVALYHQADPHKARHIAQFMTLFGLFTTTLAGGLMLLFAPELAGNLPGLVEPLRWSTLILISQTLSGLFLGLLAGLEQFRTITLIVFFQNVVMLSLTAWWAPIWGLVGTILAMAAGFFITLLLACRKIWPLVGPPWASWNALWIHRRILIEFCLPSLLGGLIILPATWFATKMIASHHGPVEYVLAGLLVLPPSWLASLGLAYEYSSGLRQVALFTAADQFRPILSLLANLVAQPMMPLVTNQIRQAEQPDNDDATRSRARRGAQRAIERSFQLAACMILPAHAFFAFAAPYVMALFGRAFAADWNIFLVVLAWGAVTGMTSLIGVSLYAQGQVWMQNGFMVLYGIILVLVTWLTQAWGEFALAAGHLAGTLATFTLGSWILHRTGFLSWHAIVVHLLAYAWITFISLVSFWIPPAWRIASIPLAVGITGLLLMGLLRAETKYVLLLLQRKFFPAKIYPASETAR
jgi:O-antigen/teichoic acid export membrane protein